MSEEQKKYGFSIKLTSEENELFDLAVEKNSSSRSSYLYLTLLKSLGITAYEPKTIPEILERLKNEKFWIETNSSLLSRERNIIKKEKERMENRLKKIINLKVDQINKQLQDEIFESEEKHTFEREIKEYKVFIESGNRYGNIDGRRIMASIRDLAKHNSIPIYQLSVKNQKNKYARTKEEIIKNEKFLKSRIDTLKHEIKWLSFEETNKIRDLNLKYEYERKLLLKSFTAYYEWGVKRRENMGWKGWIKDLWGTEIWEQATAIQFEYYCKLNNQVTYNCPKCGKECNLKEVLIHHPFGYSNCYKIIFSLEHTELICKDHEHFPEKIFLSTNNLKLNEKK